MNRPLSDIPTGASVMLDANVLVYALTPQAQLHAACRNLLERGARGTASLFTSVSVTADVLHRAMVLELLAQGQAQRSAEAVALLRPALGAQAKGGSSEHWHPRPPRVGVKCIADFG